MITPAIFADRDGTIIEDLNYAKDPEKVRLLHGAAQALSALRESGFLVAVVSNQSGVGRGLITMEDVESVHQRMVELLAEQGVTIDASSYCPHAPWEGCECRKPSPKMLIEIAETLGVDRSSSYLIGDKPSDIEMAAQAGCRSIFIGPADGSGAAEADHQVDDWDEVVTTILQPAGEVRT